MERNLGERQRWAWLASGLSAAAAACACGLGWQWVLLGGLAVSGYYIYMDRRLQDCGMAALLPQTFGWLGKALALLMLFWTILIMSWVATLADTAFPMVDGFPGLGWILLALAAWGSRKGAAACARCSGVLCLFLIVLYGVVALFALPDVELGNLRPTGHWTQSLWAVGLFLLPAGVWFVPCTSRRKGPVWQMALLLPAASALLAAVTAGVLSPELAASRTVPLYDLAQSVSMFGVIERIEPLLSAAMTMGVFSLLSALACACQSLADQMKPWQWNGTGACVLSGGLMYVTRDLSLTMLTVGAVLFWLVIPFVTTLVAAGKSPSDAVS